MRVLFHFVSVLCVQQCQLYSNGATSGNIGEWTEELKAEELMQKTYPLLAIEGDINRQEMEYYLESRQKRDKVPGERNNRTIAYNTAFLETISDPLDKKRYKEVLQNAIDELERYTCLHFVVHTNERNYLNFTFNNIGCVAGLGQLEGSQVISLSSKCLYKGTMLHMILHPLGFLHEHTRSDRDKYVKFNSQNIDSRVMENFNKYPSAAEASLLRYGQHKRYSNKEPPISFSYDFNSVMHPSMKFFSMNGLPTIEPVDKNVNRNDLGQRLGLSKIDVNKINKIYQCTGVVNNKTDESPMDALSSGDGLEKDESSGEEIQKEKSVSKEEDENAEEADSAIDEPAQVTNSSDEKEKDKEKETEKESEKDNESDDEKEAEKETSESEDENKEMQDDSEESQMDSKEPMVTDTATPKPQQSDVKTTKAPFPQPPANEPNNTSQEPASGAGGSASGQPPNGVGLGDGMATSGSEDEEDSDAAPIGIADNNGPSKSSKKRKPKIHLKTIIKFKKGLVH